MQATVGKVAARLLGVRDDYDVGVGKDYSMPQMFARRKRRGKWCVVLRHPIVWWPVHFKVPKRLSHVFLCAIQARILIVHSSRIEYESNNAKYARCNFLTHHT